MVKKCLITNAVLLKICKCIAFSENKTKQIRKSFSKTDTSHFTLTADWLHQVLKFDFFPHFIQLFP